MHPSAHTRLARAAGAAVGIAAATALLIAARPGGVLPPVPADVVFTLAPPGTIEASPAAPAILLAADRLLPGARRATADFRLRNQSGRTLAVGLRGRPDSRSLDGIVRVRITSRALVIVDTTLQGLRRGSTATVRIRSGASRLLSLQAWIPADVVDGYQARVVDVTLVVTAKTAGARR